IVVAWAHAVDRMGALYLFVAFERITQRLAEFGGAGLGFLQGDGNRGLYEQARIPGVGGKGVAAARAVAALIALQEVHTRGLQWMIVGQLLRDHHGSGRGNDAFGAFSGDPDEVSIDHAMSVI